MTQVVLGTTRCLAKQQMLKARPHLTGDVPGEHVEFMQSSIRQTMARRAVRRDRKKGDLGVWYGAWVCILAHERGPVSGGESPLLFDIQTAPKP